MANTTELQHFTGLPSSDRALRCRPLPATWQAIANLTLTLESLYSQLCFECEAGAWVAIDPSLQAEVDRLVESGFVEVAAA